MKKQDNSKQNESHNVYSAYNERLKNNYRLRLYRNDNKIFEKQLAIPQLSYFSMTEQVQDILSRFIEKIGQKGNEEEKTDYYTSKLLNSLNTAYLFANMLEELRNSELEQKATADLALIKVMQKPYPTKK